MVWHTAAIVRLSGGHISTTSNRNALPYVHSKQNIVLVTGRREYFICTLDIYVCNKKTIT